jgi:DNA anti-recombination protein RmuC
MPKRKTAELKKKPLLQAVSPEPFETIVGEKKKNLKDLAKDIVASYDSRIKIVGDIIEDTHKMMGDFREKRENMSKELKEILAKCESLRKKDFDRMMADIVLKQNEREEQVKKMLDDFRKEEEAVAEKLRTLLGKGEEIRLRDFKKMMADIKSEQEKRTKETGESISKQLQKMREEVYAMLDNFKKERQSVASAWHEAIDLFHKEKGQKF